MFYKFATRTVFMLREQNDTNLYMDSDMNSGHHIESTMTVSLCVTMPLSQSHQGNER